MRTGTTAAPAGTFAPAVRAATRGFVALEANRASGRPASRMPRSATLTRPLCDRWREWAYPEHFPTAPDHDAFAAMRHSGTFPRDGRRGPGRGPPAFCASRRSGLRAVAPQARSARFLSPEQRQEQLHDDESDDDKLEHGAPAGLDLTAHEAIGLREQRLLGVDARLPRADAKTTHGALVDAGQIEVADHLERVVDAFGKLGELDEPAHHRSAELDPRASHQIGDRVAAPCSAEFTVNSCELGAKKVVVVAQLEELGSGKLEDVGDIAAAGGLEDEGAVPVDDDEVVLEVAVRVLQNVLPLARGKVPAVRFADDQTRERRGGEHLARKRVAIERAHENDRVRLDAIPAGPAGDPCSGEERTDLLSRELVELGRFEDFIA